MEALKDSLRKRIAASNTKRTSRKRANEGKGWEATLNAMHYLYRSTGVAWVIQTPPKVKVLSPIKGGKFLACFEGLGPPDYAGAVRGVPVVFDAKETANPGRWSLAEVKQHQASHLTNAEACGAFCFIALLHPSGSWVLPWSELGPRWRAWRVASSRGRAPKGSASLSPDDIAEIGVPFGRDGWISCVPTNTGTPDGS